MNNASRKPKKALRMKGSGRSALTVAIVAGLTASVLTACGSSDEQAAPNDLRVPVALGLQRDTAGLESWLATSSDPTSSTFLATLPETEFAQKFSPDQAAANQLLNSLTSQGFTGSLAVNGSVIVGTLPVSLAHELFDANIQIQDKGAIQVAAPHKPPEVIGNWGSLVSEVVGLQRTIPPETDQTPGGTASQSERQASPSPSPSIANSLPTTPCPQAKSDTSKFQEFYGMEPLFAQGATGSNVRVAALQVAEVSPPAIELARHCSKSNVPRVTTTLVAGTDESVLVKSSPEPTLDAMAAGVMAPGLKQMAMYQFDQYQSIVFPLSAAVTDSFGARGPEILTSSIGVCEPSMTKDERTLAEWVLSSGAAGGLTTISSAGDYGSSGCSPQNTDEAAQYPASSAYVTGIGGTQLDFGAPKKVVESVWNSQSGNAGGGAQKTSIGRPSYQSQLPGPKNRLVPDIAAVADPSEFKSVPVCVGSSCSFQGVGGTSASAPGFAAGLASVLQYVRKTSGKPSMKLGAVNPFLYSLASTSGSGNPFNDVTLGTNDINNVGCCTAAAGYDSASGWGSVNFDRLAASYSDTIKK